MIQLASATRIPTSRGGGAPFEGECAVQIENVRLGYYYLRLALHISSAFVVMVDILGIDGASGPGWH